MEKNAKNITMTTMTKVSETIPLSRIQLFFEGADLSWRFPILASNSRRKVNRQPGIDLPRPLILCTTNIEGKENKVVTNRLNTEYSIYHQIRLFLYMIKLQRDYFLFHQIIL